MVQMVNLINKKEELKEMMNNKTKVLVFLLLLATTIIGGMYIYNNRNTIRILKQYNPKTKVTDVSEYFIRNNDTIFQGKFTRYNSKGIKIAEGQFFNNEPVGKNTYFYDDGKLESIYHKKNSKVTTEVVEYYHTGKIKRYVMFDPFGHEAFIARYDEKGKIKNYEGYPLMEIYQYPIAHKDRFKIKSNQYLKVGDKLKYKYIIANIPNTKRSFKIENISTDNSKVKRTSVPVLPVQIDVEEILTKKGKNTIRSIVSYEFNYNIMPVFADTLSFNVNVN